MIQKYMKAADESLTSKDSRRCLFSLDQAAKLAMGDQGYPTPWMVKKAEALIQAKHLDDAINLLKYASKFLSIVLILLFY
jgi:hypothetical protein